MSRELGVWSLLGGEAGSGTGGPGFAVVVIHVGWARWLLGEIVIGSSVSGESLVGDFMWSLDVSKWIVNPCWVDDKSRWGWSISNLNSGCSGNQSEEFHIFIIISSSNFHLYGVLGFWGRQRLPSRLLMLLS